MSPHPCVIGLGRFFGGELAEDIADPFTHRAREIADAVRRNIGGEGADRFR